MKMMDDDDDMNVAATFLIQKKYAEILVQKKTRYHVHLIDSVFMDKSKQNSVKKTKFK